MVRGRELQFSLRFYPLGKGVMVPWLRSHLVMELWGWELDRSCFRGGKGCSSFGKGKDVPMVLLGA